MSACVCERRACIVCAVLIDNVFVLLCNEPLSKHRFHLTSPFPFHPSPPPFLPLLPSLFHLLLLPKWRKRETELQYMEYFLHAQRLQAKPSDGSPADPVLPVSGSGLAVRLQVVAEETCISCLAANEAASVHLGK